MTTLISEEPAIGTLLAIFGLWGWLNRQRVADEREDHDLAKARFEIRKLTDDERQEKQEREAAGILDEVYDIEPSVTYVGIPELGREEEQRLNDTPTRDYRFFIDKLDRLEQHLGAVLAATLPEFSITTGVRISNYSADVLAVDEGRRLGYVLNLKYSGSHLQKNLHNRLSDSASLAAAAVGIRQRYGFPIKPVLLLIVAAGSAVPPRDFVVNKARVMEAAFSVKVSLAVIAEEAFLSMDSVGMLRVLASDPTRKTSSAAADTPSPTSTIARQ